MKALSKRARLVMLLGLILPAAPGHSQQASSAGAATGPFAAQSLDGDLRRLPLAETWRAGAPVVVKHQAELARLLSDPDAWRIPSAPLSQDPIAQTSARATTAAQLGPPLFTATGIPFTGVPPPGPPPPRSPPPRLGGRRGRRAFRAAGEPPAGRQPLPHPRQSGQP